MTGKRTRSAPRIFVRRARKNTRWPDVNHRVCRGQFLWVEARAGNISQRTRRREKRIGSYSRRCGAANSVRLNNRGGGGGGGCGRTPVIRIVLRLPISGITFSYGGGRFFSHRPKTAGGNCHFFVSLKDVQAFFTFQVEICTGLLYNIPCIRASGYRSPDIFHTSFSRAPQFLKEEK